MTASIKEKEIKNNNKFLRDDFVLKLLRDKDMVEYLVRLISSILKERPDIIGEDFEIINSKIGVSTDVKDAEGDVIIKSKCGYFNVEVNYNPFNREIDNKNMSYVCSLVLRQMGQGKEYPYKDVKKVIQINLDRFDYFEKEDFIYSSGVFEEKYHLPRTDILKIYDINLDYLKKISYNEIRDLDIDTPEKLLYILTCEDKSIWESIYGDDELMKKVEDKINELDVVLDTYLAYDRKAFNERTAREAYDEESRKEVRSETRLENAKALIHDGFDKFKVIESLKLTKDEINALDI